MNRRSELSITALQATTASLSAQIAALSQTGVTATKLLNNVQASTTNVPGPGTVPAWSGSFTAVGGNQAFFLNFTALTGESGGQRTYQLFIDGVPAASRTITHNDGYARHAVSFTALTQLSAGSHAFGIVIPADSAVNDGDFADVLMVEF